MNKSLNLFILIFCYTNVIKRKLERFSGQLIKTWVMHSCCHFMPLQRLERVAAKLWRRKDDILGLIGITLILAVFGTVFSAGKHDSFNTLSIVVTWTNLLLNLRSKAIFLFKLSWAGVYRFKHRYYRYRCQWIAFFGPGKVEDAINRDQGVN